MACREERMAVKPVLLAAWHGSLPAEASEVKAANILSRVKGDGHSIFNLSSTFDDVPLGKEVKSDSTCASSISVCVKVQRNKLHPAKKKQ